jgi:hypothetical protein
MIFWRPYLSRPPPTLRDLVSQVGYCQKILNAVFDVLYDHRKDTVKQKMAENQYKVPSEGQ